MGYENVSSAILIQPYPTMVYPKKTINKSWVFHIKVLVFRRIKNEMMAVFFETSDNYQL
jgi:hypothetical protein